MNYLNLVEMHRRQAERFGPLPALSFKRDGLYRDVSWNDYRAAALAGAAALIEAGVQPGDRVGLVSENRVEWLIADMAILTAGAVNVPPHAPLTARQIHYQLEDAGAIWLIVSDRQQLEKVRQIRGQLPPVRGVVVFEMNAAAEDAETWAAFLQRGRTALPHLADELRRREQALGTEQLATIMYTSGTTGNPKGVMLTHGNLVSNSLACLEVTGHKPDDVRLSWLPYSHIYARTIDHYCSIAAGVHVALAESADTVVQNLADVQPTHMASVPRFYEKVLTAVAVPDPAETGRRLRALFGPRIDWMSSGGAPLPLPVAQAFHAAGLLVVQGYGLTETSPVITLNKKHHYKLDTVGQALPNVEVKIAADGEILTRGPHVMKGYWHDPKATAAAIQDGWFHTGDVGELDADGFLKITGRKKELMVLSNGKKVVPSHLEGLLQSDPCIDQAVVVGEGRNYLSALIVPAWDNVAKELQAAGETLVDNEDVRASQPAVHNLLRRRIDAALADVSKMEQVKKFIVLPRPFSVAAEEMTVSLKLRRNVVLTKYAAQLESLYGERPHEATMLEIDANIHIPDTELDWSYVRSSGPGGQNVNKVASKAVLRWNVVATAALPEDVKARLLVQQRGRVTTEGDLLLTSQRYRDQERNRDDCLRKLTEIVTAATIVPKVRKKKKPTRASKERRLAAKKHRSDVKKQRRPAHD